MGWGPVCGMFALILVSPPLCRPYQFCLTGPRFDVLVHSPQEGPGARRQASAHTVQKRLNAQDVRLRRGYIVRCAFPSTAMSSIYLAACAGVVASVIGAALNALIEPILNRIILKKAT